MNPLNLLWIIPVSVSAGLFLGGMLAANNELGDNSTTVDHEERHEAHE